MRVLAIAVTALMTGLPWALATQGQVSRAGEGPREPQIHRGHGGHGPGHHGPGRGARHAARHGAGHDAEQPPGLPGGHGHGMSEAEHGNIAALLSGHRSIDRTVEEIEGGVRTRTVTNRPELVASLREHVLQMSNRLEAGSRVRAWDPLFREIFAHSDEISMTWTEIEGGIEVVETSENPEVVALIRAHASKVDSFVAGGHEAARPPWAGGRGRGQRRRP